MNVTYLREYITHEIEQQHQTGHDVTEVLQRWDGGAGISDADLRDFYDEVQRECPHDGGPEMNEPSDLAEIMSLWPQDHSPVTTTTRLPDQLLAAWQGRIAGNMLGKPVEEGVYWTRKRLRTYAEEAGAWPLENYFPVTADLRERYQLREDNVDETTLGSISGSSRDDDVDYTILGLHVLETYGLSFTSAHIAEQWLLRLPYLQVFTAERAAYGNLVNGLTPPHTATHDNPFREWIGALIRADIFGYVCPGDPRRAAELAYRDARVSHVANGIYGEQWAAALVASAFTAENAQAALSRARCYVPEGSRTAQALDAVTTLHDGGATWEETLADADVRWSGYNWVHTVNNVAVIAAALLYGEGDFTRSIALTVLGGLDTDSTGATSGSVMGILLGTAGIPRRWTEPLIDQVRSAVFGFDEIPISELARRTLQIATPAG